MQWRFFPQENAGCIRPAVKRKSMNMIRCHTYLASGALSAALLATTGCKELPGTPQAQGATIGGLGGAAAGAAIGGKDNRLLGAVIGGAVGAAGGYVIGANKDRITGKDSSGAQAAANKAETQPATAEQARNATTGDINNDGFVTMDEVVALEQAGYNDDEILKRLEATGQVFELTEEQKSYLRSHGLDQKVIDKMADLNHSVRESLQTNTNREVIGRPASSTRSNSSTY
jgi:hypothetical protein